MDKGFGVLTIVNVNIRESFQKMGEKNTNLSFGRTLNQPPVKTKKDYYIFKM